MKGTPLFSEIIMLAKAQPGQAGPHDPAYWRCPSKPTAKCDTMC